MFRKLGWTNIIVEMIPGGTPSHFKAVLDAFIHEHSDYLIDNGHGGLILPPGFNMLLVDNLTYCTTDSGAIKPQVLGPNSEVYNECRDGLCSTVSFSRRPW